MEEGREVLSIVVAARGRPPIVGDNSEGVK